MVATIKKKVDIVNQYDKMLFSRLIVRDATQTMRAIGRKTGRPFFEPFNRRGKKNAYVNYRSG